MKDKKYFVHSVAIADDGCDIGEGTRIWAFSHVMAGAHIGKNCNVGEHVYIEHGVTLGDGVKVKNNISLYSGLTCEDDVFLGPACVFTNVVNPRSAFPKKDEFKSTLVRWGATVGAGAVIVCGITIGRCAFIGAGSVVTKDVADYRLVYGNPARPHGYMCECGAKLTFTGARARCGCGAEYTKNKIGIQKI